MAEGIRWLREQKSKVDGLALDVHVVLGFELQPLHLLLVARVDPLHPQREPRPDLLHVHALVPLAEDVAVVPEEDEVALVVEGDHAAPAELGVLREERGEHAAHAHPDLGIEVVEDEFGDVLGGDCVVADVLLELDAGDLEDRQHALQVPHQQFPPVRVPQHHHVREVQVLRVPVDLLQLHLAPRVVGHVVEHHHQLPQQLVDLDGRFEGGGHEDLDGPVVVQDLVELVEDCLVVLLDVLLAALLLVLDGDGLLPFRGGQLLAFLALLHLDLVLDDAALVVDFLPLLLVLDLVRLLLEGRGELLHRLRPHPHCLRLPLPLPRHLLVRLRLLLLCHC